MVVFDSRYVAFLLCMTPLEYEAYLSLFVPKLVSCTIIQTQERTIEKEVPNKTAIS